MTQRSGGGFFDGVELGKVFGGIFIEGTKTSLATETQETIPVKSVHRIIEPIPGNKAGFERVRGYQCLHPGLFLGSFGDESLKGRLAVFFVLRLKGDEEKGEEGKDKKKFHNKISGGGGRPWRSRPKPDRRPAPAGQSHTFFLGRGSRTFPSHK